MGSALSSDIKKEAAELAPTSSSDVGSDDSDKWTPIGSLEDNDSEDEDDVDLEERLCILQESRKLKMMAEFFLHPENPVENESTACGRCYFDRPSAPQQELLEESEECGKILEETRALKKLAVDYHHPELPVEVSDTASARCYFDRASAPQQEEEEEEERAVILSELAQLKKAAYDYLHPEAPVATNDPTVFGRCYFARPSAPEQVDAQTEEERGAILKEAQELAKQARKATTTSIETDATAFARNYFTRPSAPDQSSLEEEEERELILRDAKALRKLAIDYHHPELPIETTDATVFGRNYFTRPSAPASEEDEERSLVLSEARALGKLAVDYRHPELPVSFSDPTVFGRNYFERPSAPARTNPEESEQVEAELQQLKKLAKDYMHPELPVETSDPTIFGHNYFTRPSAPMQSTDADEREQVLADAHRLKKLAVDYHHPELPVQTSDLTIFGRNYFTRPSASTQSTNADEREQVLADAQCLKKLAVNYMHPELPVEASDPTVFGRNYFTRPSAPMQSTDAEQERRQVLADAKCLKKLAVYYMHPELPVETSDPTVFGRNYFTRPSAPMQSADAEEERKQVLADAHRLEKLAIDYHHPELPVQTAEESDFYYHHAHFDMDDDIHLHHVDFDRNTDHHEDITELKITSPTATRPVIQDFDMKLAMSPGCVMTFAHPKDSAQLPYLE